MKRFKPPAEDQKSNLLQDVHSQMIHLPINFRERVCAECSWSVPTFYRKMRLVSKVVPGGNGEKEKITPSLSNAEKEKIMAVLDEIFNGYWSYTNKYRKKAGKG